jgi:hypothetical protein
VADYSGYKPNIGTTDYTTKYPNFVDELQARANEIETAREGETDLQTNLSTNYLSYTLGDNISGSSNTYKCTNMAPAVSANDYVTKNQVDGLTGDVPTDITELSPGGIAANQIIVASTNGTTVTGRDTTYTQIGTTPFSAAYNKMYDMNIDGAKTINLPAGIEGGIIGFADLGGNAGDYTITINANGTDKLMDLSSPNNVLTVDDFQNISFKLVYSGATYGWVVTELQR